MPAKPSQMELQLMARVQEPCESLSLSRTRSDLRARGQEPRELISLYLSLSLTPSLALFWLTRPLLGSLRRCHAAALYPALEMSLPWKLENWAELLQHGHLSLKWNIFRWISKSLSQLRPCWQKVVVLPHIPRSQSIWFDPMQSGRTIELAPEFNSYVEKCHFG